MSSFGLIKSFGIDDGELDGLRPQDCFVLGYELAMIDHLLKSGDEISQPIHAENYGRIEKSCVDAKRTYSLKWFPGDPSETWVQLWVEESK